MLANLAAGPAVFALSLIIPTLRLVAVTHAMGRFVGMFRVHGHRSRTMAMIFVVFGLFAVLTVEVWLWAAAHLMLGAFDSFDDALYFSTVTFSTLGYGDLLPHPEWRLFAALEGVNGFLLIGWSTAYLVAAGMRVGPFRSGEHF